MKLLCFGMRGNRDIVYSAFDGYLVAESSDGIAFAFTPSNEQIELWLPKRKVEEVWYHNQDLDKNVVSIGEKVLGFKLPRWLAENRGLVFEEG